MYQKEFLKFHNAASSKLDKCNCLNIYYAVFHFLLATVQVWGWQLTTTWQWKIQGAKRRWVWVYHHISIILPYKLPHKWWWCIMLYHIISPIHSSQQALWKIHGAKREPECRLKMWWSIIFLAVPKKIIWCPGNIWLVNVQIVLLLNPSTSEWGLLATANTDQMLATRFITSHNNDLTLWFLL